MTQPSVPSTPPDSDPAPLTIGNGKPGPGRPKESKPTDPVARRALVNAERLYREARARLAKANREGNTELELELAREARMANDQLARLRGETRNVQVIAGQSVEGAERIVSEWSAAHALAPREVAELAAETLRAWNRAHPSEALEVVRPRRPRRFEASDGAASPEVAPTPDR